MVEIADINTPIGWKVSYTSKPGEKLTGAKRFVGEEVFQEKEVAEAFKRQQVAQGMLATVTPHYMRVQQRGKVRKAGQERAAPKGFNKTWHIPQG